VSALCEKITADSYGEDSHGYRLKVCNNFERILFCGLCNKTFNIKTTVLVEKFYFSKEKKRWHILFFKMMYNNFHCGFAIVDNR
jgi:hypothetical protein